MAFERQMVSSQLVRLMSRSWESRVSVSSRSRALNTQGVVIMYSQERVLYWNTTV